MQITEHFALEEFTDVNHHSLCLIQYEMIQNLAKILEAFRTLCGSSIKITSGLRTREDYLRLQAQGHNPSITSDHFFGQVIPLHVTAGEKRRKYGEFYTFSVGAVDIVFNDIVTEKAFDLIYSHRNAFNIGQLILEKNKYYWIHVSNPASLIYSDAIANAFLKREKYLVSLDNGKTYIDMSTYYKGKFK